MKFSTMRKLPAIRYITHTAHITHTHTHTYRDDLVLEIDSLQQSSSKLNEDRIFELKQRIEDVLMEQDALSSRNSNLKREATLMR